MSNPYSPTSASIYVGDIAPEVDETILYEIFKRVGTVTSTKVCRDSTTKKSLGYGYVNFLSIEEANRAINTFNNTEIKGKSCRVMWSNRDPSSRRSGLGNIFISNLDPKISSKELHDTFTQFGNILSCKVVSRGEHALGYVHFEHPSSANTAISIVNGKLLGNNVVHVMNFIPRAERLKFIENTWKNIYVKNLPQSIAEDKDLQQLFAPFGETTSCRIMKKPNGDSLNFGFVAFKNHEDAVMAVQKMDGLEVDGNKLHCARFKPWNERQVEKNRLREIRKRERINYYLGRNLFIKNIEDGVTEDLLRKEFEAFGNISSILIERNENGTNKGFGYVCFSTKEEATKALNATDKKLILPGFTKPLFVNFHEPKEDRISRVSSFRPRMKNFQPYGPMMYPPYFYPPQAFNNQRTMKVGNQGGRGQGKGNPRNVRGQNQNPLHQQQQKYPRNPSMEQQQQQAIYKNAFAHRLYEKIIYMNESPEFASALTGAVINSEDFKIETSEELLSEDSKLRDLIKKYKSLRPDTDSNEVTDDQ